MFIRILQAAGQYSRGWIIPIDHGLSFITQLFNSVHSFLNSTKVLLQWPLTAVDM